jgi:hypothetical protein
VSGPEVGARPGPGPGRLRPVAPFAETMSEHNTSRISDLPDALILRIFAIIPCRLHHGLNTCKNFSNILVGTDNFPLSLLETNLRRTGLPSKETFLRYTGNICLRIHAEGNALQAVLLCILDAVSNGWTKLETIDISCVALSHCVVARILLPIIQRQCHLRCRPKFKSMQFIVPLMT